MPSELQAKNVGEAGNALDPDAQGRDFAALSAILSVLQPLDDDARRRLLQTVATFLGVGQITTGVPSVPASSRSAPRVGFSDDTTISVKDFLLEKQPKTDVERVACLSYYLTHYRDTPHFKTLDLSKLNTEAAQPKFVNAANTANNALKMGYLVPASRGQRQLSAAGEQFVRALPDRDAAKEVMASVKPRKKIVRRQRSADLSQEN